MVEALFGAILASLIPGVQGDVGFSDSQAYLVTQFSPDQRGLCFSLSEESASLSQINFKSQRCFDENRLRELIDRNDLELDLKIELENMLNGSLMSAYTSTRFLSALSEILAQYDTNEEL